MVDGVPLREHYAAIWKRSGTKPDELKNELPDWLGYLWQWFLELHQTRGSGMEGMQRITYAEIDAWIRLTGNVVDWWDVRAIKAVDSVACKPKEK